MSTDYKINRLISPFMRDASPYENREFDWKVYDYCDQIELIGGDNICGSSKCIVVGDTSVGKTCLVKRFKDGEFSCDHKDTIGVDFDVKNFKILGTSFDLQLWDTAGQEKFCCIVKSYYRGANVAVIVFDFSNITSLGNTMKWFRQVMDATSDQPPITFLVGTKKDIVSESTYKFVEREAIKMSERISAEYWPISSKTGEGVVDLFCRIAALSFQQTILARVKQLEDIKGNGEIVPKLTNLKKSKSIIVLNKKKSLNRIKKCCFKSS